MSDDTISRQAAIDALEKDKASLDNIIKSMSAIDVRLDHYVAQHNQVDYDIDTIKNLPSAEPQERKTGQWITHKRTYLGKKLNDCVECSECGIWFSACELRRRSYCPDCGARMEEEHETD